MCFNIYIEEEEEYEDASTVKEFYAKGKICGVQKEECTKQWVEDDDVSEQDSKFETTAFRYLRAGQEDCGTFGLLEENPKELKADGVGQKKDMPSTNKSNKSHKDDLYVLGLQS